MPISEMAPTDKDTSHIALGAQVPGLEPISQDPAWRLDEPTLVPTASLIAGVEAYLDSCRAKLGWSESPARSNCVRGITDQPGFWCDQWCAMGASVCCRDVGIPLWTASVAGIMDRAQSGRDGWSWGGEPRIGALVCFDWGDGGQRTDHVGACVEAIRSDGMLVVIECNHNDRCERVVRHPSNNVLGFAYPPLGGGGRRNLTHGDSGPDVTEAQNKLNAFGYGLDADGSFGDGTGAAVLNLQFTHGLGVDGEIGPATWAVLDAGPPKPPAPPAPQEPHGLVFVISPANSELAMDAAGGGTTVGTPVCQWPLHGGGNQRWVVDVIDGGWRIRSAESGLVLDQPGPGAVMLQNWLGGQNQIWRPTAVTANTVVLHNVLTGDVLDIEGSSSEAGAKVIAWAFNGSANQTFSFIRAADQAAAALRLP